MSKIVGADAVSCVIGGVMDTTIQAAAKAKDYEDYEEFFEKPGCWTATAKSTTSIIVQQAKVW